MNTKMNATNLLYPAIGGEPLPHAPFGLLLPADECVDYVGTPRSGRPRGPVLAANCNLTRLQAAMDGRAGRASFGFGGIAGPGFSVVTIRCQLGSMQFYWLADASDPEVWSPIDTWRANRQASVMMVENGLAMYSVHEIDWIPGKSKSRTDDMRVECGKDHSVAFLSFATLLVASGLLEEQATTDLPGIPLSDVRVNVLLTERLKQYVLPEPLTGQPMLVLPGTTGAPDPATMH